MVMVTILLRIKVVHTIKYLQCVRSSTTHVDYT